MVAGCIWLSILQSSPECQTCNRYEIYWYRSKKAVLYSENHYIFIVEYIVNLMFNKTY